jgi:hypothetical protein
MKPVQPDRRDKQMRAGRKILAIALCEAATETVIVVQDCYLANMKKM